jgi:hypothetical protein
MLEAIKNMWSAFIGFLTENDFQKISEWVRELKWTELIASPWVWVAVIIIVLLSVWKRRTSYLVLACSCVLFIVLLQHTLPPAGEGSMPLSSILEFLGGCVLLIGVNLYLLMLREN